MLKDITREYVKYIEASERYLDEKRAKNRELFNNKDLKEEAKTARRIENDKQYRANIAYLQMQARPVVNAYIKAAREAVYKRVAADIPAEVAGMLETMRAMGEVGALSETQARVYLEKYRDCYPAFYAVLSTAHKYKLCKNVSCVDPEAMENNFKYLEKQCDQVFSTDIENNSLSVAYACQDTYRDRINTIINSFVAGHYEDPYAAAEHEESALHAGLAASTLGHE